MIYHISLVEDWGAQSDSKDYIASSLAIEGFIHCSKANQLMGVLDRYYQGVPEIILFSIVEEKLSAKLQYDFADSVNEEFPHVYGPINKSAILNVHHIERNSEGNFDIEKFIN